jgi:tripartite-type tricarboxylate transporter receptor subunit TctC
VGGIPRPQQEKPMRRLLVSLVAIASLASGVSRVSAEDYPVRPIRIVLPFAAGGAVDIISRLLGEKMTAAWGQPVIIDGKPGAGGIVATNVVAKSPGDGYTLLMTTANLTINPSLHKDLPYDTQRDLVPVAQLIGIPDVIVVRADVPAHNLAELIALAKSKPGKLNYASPGVGTFPHLAFELFKKQAGIDIVHIPYKGASQATVAMLAKEVDVMSTNISDVKQFIESGAMRALAVTSARRSQALPDVPTIAESGLSGFEAVGWMGVLAPAGTPKPVVDKLNRQIVDSLKAGDMTKMLVTQGFDMMTGTPEDFAAFIARDIPRWAEAVKTSGATVN